MTNASIWNQYFYYINNCTILDKNGKIITLYIWLFEPNKSYFMVHGAILQHCGVIATSFLCSVSTVNFNIFYGKTVAQIKKW